MQETQVQSLSQEDPLEKGTGNPLQYFCLENPRGAWWAIVHGVTKSRTQLSNFHLLTHVEVRANLINWEKNKYI